MISKVLTEKNTEKIHALHVASLLTEVVHVRITVPLTEFHRHNKVLLSLYADMLERGSEEYTKDAYEENLETLGADVHIGSNADTLSVAITARATTLPQVLSILEATFKKPLFDSLEIKKIKKEYIQQMRELRDNTRYLASALFSRELFAESALEYVPTLEEQQKLLSAIHRDALLKIHRGFRTGAWLVTVAGTQESYDAVCAFASTLQEDGVAHSAVNSQRLEPVPSHRSVEYVPGKQNVELCIGNHVPLFPDDPLYTAFLFGVDILGKRGGFAGRLMSTVREKEGLTYSIYAWLAGVEWLCSGYFIVSTFFTPQDIERGLTSTFREIRTLVEKGVTTNEIERFKVLLKNQFALTFESTQGIVTLYHGALVRNLPIEFVEAYPERIMSVTKKEINTALATYLHPDQLVVAGAGTLEKIPDIT